MANLFDLTEASLAALGKFDKMLIDPPRDGAIDLVKSLNEDAPSRIVYVSCNPATLARDAGVLVNIKGYTLKAAGIVNMFPHTGHVESIAWFEKTGPGLSREEVAALDAAEAEAREAAKAAKKARNAAAAKAKADEEAARVARKAARLAHYLANQAAYDARSAKK